MDYRKNPEYKKKIEDLCNWVISKHPEYSKNSAMKFAENILRKKYPDFIKNIQKAEEQKERDERNRIAAIKRETYLGQPLDATNRAQIGDCFLFVSGQGIKYLMVCIGYKEYQGYDYKEWCVADRDYTYTLPIFHCISDRGKETDQVINSTALKITKAKYDKLINEFRK